MTFVIPEHFSLLLPIIFFFLSFRPINAILAELMKGCRDLVHLSIELCEEIKMKKDTTTTLGRVSNSLSQIIELKKRILPELAIDISKDIGDQLKQELLDMENSIKEAATKIKVGGNSINFWEYFIQFLKVFHSVFESILINFWEYSLL